MLFYSCVPVCMLRLARGWIKLVYSVHYKARRCLQQWIYAAPQLASFGGHSATAKQDLQQRYHKLLHPFLIPIDFHAMCKNTDTLWIHQQCFLFSTVVRFTPFPTCSPKLGRISLADISLHTQQDLISLQGSHPQSASTPPPPPPLSLCFCLFSEKTEAFYVTEACCSLQAQGCGSGFGPGPHLVEKH